jgi:hypothetical protein
MTATPTVTPTTETTADTAPGNARAKDVEIRVVGERKSFIAGFLLAFLFGPLGLLYSSVGLGLLMMLVGGGLALITLGLSIFITWPLCWVLSPIAIAMHNGGREKTMRA